VGTRPDGSRRRSPACAGSQAARDLAFAARGPASVLRSVRSWLPPSPASYAVGVFPCKPLSHQLHAILVAVMERRTFLRLALSPLLLAGLPEALKAETRKKLKPIILIWADGGLSAFETFDSKPDSPTEIRGLWGSIRTTTGAIFSDRFPLT